MQKGEILVGTYCLAGYHDVDDINGPCPECGDGILIVADKPTMEDLKFIEEMQRRGAGLAEIMEALSKRREGSVPPKEGVSAVEQ